MQKIIIIGMCISLLLLSGCCDCCKGLDPICYYNKAYQSCSSNNINQYEYCQCWASCDTENGAVGKDCHLRCKDYWNDDCEFPSDAKCYTA